MRGWLVLVFVAACSKGGEPPPSPSSAARRLRQATVQETLIVVLPLGADAAAVATDVSAHLSPTGDAKAMSRVELAPYMRRIAAHTDLKLTPDQNGGVELRATGEPVATLRTVANAALGLAQQQHGWVIDPVTDGFYPAEDFEKHLPGQVVDVRRVMAIDFLHGENGGLVTKGMPKLGLPELRVSATAPDQSQALTVAISAAAQRLLAEDVAVPGSLDVDLATLPGDWHADRFKNAGGTAKVRWRISWTKDPETAADVLELVPAQGAGIDGARALIAECFGTGAR